jgi:5'-3' exonuclease
MGIKFLNKILRDTCDKSIWQINISELTGKKIAVDISIYLYKYETNDTLLENIYLMLAIFRQYNITPIFVFDGKAPAEKKQLLQKRREDKAAAKNEYNKLKDVLENNADKDEEEKLDIAASMDQLKKQFIHISREKIEKVKELIRAYGATYYDAPGEADELCALLVIKKKVWACLSEDMDLFVYGCNRVLRYFSLFNQTVVLYYTKGILEQLNMTQKEFREICVLSGTDYNINANTNKENSKYNDMSLSLPNTMKLFRKYKEQINANTNNSSFYEWLNNSEKTADCITDLDLLHKINNMFIVSDELTDLFKNIKIVNGPVQKETVKEIMKEDGFMFID